MNNKKLTTTSKVLVFINMMKRVKIIITTIFGLYRLIHKKVDGTSGGAQPLLYSAPLSQSSSRRLDASVILAVPSTFL